MLFAFVPLSDLAYIVLAYTVPDATRFFLKIPAVKLRGMRSLLQFKALTATLSRGKNHTVAL